MAPADLARNLYRTLPLPLRRGILVRRRAHWWRRAGIVFIHIPKAAGVSVNESLFGAFMGHYRAWEFRRYAPRDVQQLPVFTVTRNPWDRLISAYRFARAGRGQGQGPIAAITSPHLYQVPEFDSFDRFVTEWLPRQRIERLDEVFQPQSQFVFDAAGKPLVDHIGRVERLGETHLWVQQRLGRPVPPFARLNTSGDKLDYRELYNDETKAIVAEIYRDDIEHFGYSF